ncbi:MAG: hypothetical protein KGN36_20575, partial [Acidobacteriota bacterium]|nr:hypothetical protein [Acidobacteriota bacterium]
MTNQFAQALSELTAALEAAGIRYAIGGSLASSTHGLFRATEDGDIIADLSPAHASRLAHALGPAWYADADEIVSSVRAGRSFNLIHIATALKFDLFPAVTDFHAIQLDRAKIMQLRLDGSTPCPVTTAEDILLAKLRWFRDGGEVSERQWSDVLGIVATAPSLDWQYLNLWAARLGVAAL